MTKLSTSKAYTIWSEKYDAPNMLIAMERNILLDWAGDLTGKKVLDAEKKYFEAEEFKQKKGRRTLLVMKLKKK